MAEAASPELLQWGLITGPHGLRGAVRVRLANPHSPNAGLLERCFLQHEGVTRPIRLLEASAAGGGTMRLVIEDVISIEQAEALRGSLLFVAKADLPPVHEGEFYYFEVLGFEVRTVADRLVGRITEVFFNGAHEVWVVKDGADEVLIPVIEDIVKTIDRESRRILIEPIAGLLDRT